MNEHKVGKALSRMARADEIGDQSAYDRAAGKAWKRLDDAHRECLRQLLFQGPVWDGNVISKSARDDLISLGLAARCCFMGEQGYAAATYLAYTLHQAGGEAAIATKPGSPG